MNDVISWYLLAFQRLFRFIACVSLLSLSPFFSCPKKVFEEMELEKEIVEVLQQEEEDRKVKGQNVEALGFDLVIVG